MNNNKINKYKEDKYLPNQSYNLPTSEPSLKPSKKIRTPYMIISLLRINIYSIHDVEEADFTEDIMQVANEEAKRQDYIISEVTPNFLLKNHIVVISSIRKRNAVVDIVPNEIWDNELKECQKEVIDILKESQYVLNEKSPLFLRKNPYIIAQSLRRAIQTADYIDWDNLQPQYKLYLIKELISSGYILSENSPQFLKNNIEICISSIQKQPQSVDYLPQNIKNQLKSVIILTLPIYELNDESQLNDYLQTLGYNQSSQSEDEKKYYDRIKEIIKLLISTPLKVSNIKRILNIVAQKEWELERERNKDKYINLLNRTLHVLHTYESFDSILFREDYLNDVISALGTEKGSLFLQTMIEYHGIYHNPNTDAKTELLEHKREIIERSLALSISKRKEQFLMVTLEKLQSLIKPYFRISENSPKVKKRIVELKQRRLLKKLYDDENPEVINKINEIKNKYQSASEYDFISKEERKKLIEFFISSIIGNNLNNINDILLGFKPKRYDEYIIYEEVSKLINRLNSGYIKYEDSEVTKYRHLIEKINGKYIYKGQKFSEYELQEINKYKKIVQLYNNIKKDIFKIVKTIEIDDKTTEEELGSIASECAFDDENYVCKSDLLKKVRINSFNDYIQFFNEFRYIIQNDDIYEAFIKFFLHSGLIAFSLINDSIKQLLDEKLKESKKETFISMLTEFLKKKDMMDLIHLIANLSLVEGKETITFEDIERIINLKDMFKIGSLEEISILGEETARKIYKKETSEGLNPKQRIKIACDLVQRMLTRAFSTVPYVSGENENYRYSIYDPLDVTLLTSGIDTNSCLTCGGKDNDFLHYCALNKNGFVIKITDKSGNLIAKAAGFRNGNGVYVNQILPVYDRNSSAYYTEKSAIIEIFKKACDDIVKKSQENPNEKTKIDFVVVTKSMLLSDFESNIDDETAERIDGFPVENKSEDWQKFISQTPNLRETPLMGEFTTDFQKNMYVYYNLICISSAIGELTPEKIKKGDVPAMYERKRNTVTIEKASEKLEEKINRIKAANAKLSKREFKPTKIKPEQKVVTGDNWFIIIQGNEIIEGAYLGDDELAKKEFELAKEECELSKQQNHNIKLEYIQERIKIELAKQKNK